MDETVSPSHSCSSGASCGPDCCDSAALCCDNACCASGQVCTWEEVCCTPGCEPGICGDDGCGGQCGCPEGICLVGLCFRTVPSGGSCGEGNACAQYFYPDFDACVGGTNGQSCTPGSCLAGFGCLPEPISLCYTPCWQQTCESSRPGRSGTERRSPIVRSIQCGGSRRSQSASMSNFRLRNQSSARPAWLNPSSEYVRPGPSTIETMGQDNGSFGRQE